MSEIGQPDPSLSKVDESLGQDYERRWGNDSKFHTNLGEATTHAAELDVIPVGESERHPGVSKLEGLDDVIGWARSKEVGLIDDDGSEIDQESLFSMLAAFVEPDGSAENTSKLPNIAGLANVMVQAREERAANEAERVTTMPASIRFSKPLSGSIAVQELKGFLLGKTDEVGGEEYADVLTTIERFESGELSDIQDLPKSSDPRITKGAAQYVQQYLADNGGAITISNPSASAIRAAENRANMSRAPGSPKVTMQKDIDGKFVLAPDGPQHGGENSPKDRLIEPKDSAQGSDEAE